MPHDGTLSRWYSVIDGNPGYSQEALTAIKLKSQQGPVYYNLTVDKMCIKKHGTWHLSKCLWIY